MNHSIRTTRLHQRGFSLIEALIAVVVLATGLLALAALQGALIRSSADAKARSQLAAFAESTLDARRIGGYNDAPLAPGTASPKLTTAAQRTQAALAMGAATVTETTTVTQYVANAGAFTAYTTPAAAAAAMLAAGPAAATFKRVDMALSWNDASGAGVPRSLRMVTDISPLALELNNVLIDREPPDDFGLQPIVRRPSPVTEGMIPIALGDGQDTAATNPKPLLIGKKEDTLVADTRFEVLTYNPSDNLGNAAFARFNKRIETAMIGCTCQNGTGGFPTTGPDSAVNSFVSAASFRPSYWDGERYSEPERIVGGVTTSPADVGQSPLCDVCCRDHKDPNTTAAALYKPWPRITETAHGHYRLDSAGAFVVASSGEYMESCRVIRVNGIWRVTSDPRLDDLALVPTQVYSSSSTFPLPPQNSSVATSPLLSEAGKNSYANYMFDFINKRYFVGTNRNINFDDNTRYQMQGAAGLNNPPYVPLTGSSDKRWLHGRGVLVDYLLPKAITRIEKAKEDCAAGANLQTQAQCILPFLPFATINVTELARWSGRNTSEIGGTIAPEYGTTSVNFSHVRMRRHNSAVALFPAISPDDDATRLVDEQLVALLNTIRTGIWLTLSDTNGVVFGDPAAPTRGAARVAGGARFNVSWSGVTAATNNEKGDDPLLVTVPNPAQPTDEIGCTAGSAKNTSNPYVCSTDSGTGVKLGLAQFNRKVQPNQTQNSNPCNTASNAPKVPRQATCLVHVLAGVNVDGTNYTPTQVQYTLVSGTAGKANEKRSLVLPTVRLPPNASSAVTLSFNSSTVSALPVCETTFVEWSCN
ncbi:MAG: prepilin-type N-terminal cleavage/methylation domain-containing protein [Pseudomonadota bacterium]|nr:prepilin-type N-terminal cleavage/methylation domain-containing protein [Pseudomonadota bacterium]